MLARSRLVVIAIGSVGALLMLGAGAIVGQLYRQPVWLVRPYLFAIVIEHARRSVTGFSWGDGLLYTIGGLTGLAICVWAAPHWALWGRWKVIVGLGLVAAGVMANAIELAFRGSVRDYLALKVLTAPGTRPEVNDVADLAMIGGVLLIVAAVGLALTRRFATRTQARSS